MGEKGDKHSPVSELDAPSTFRQNKISASDANLNGRTGGGSGGHCEVVDIERMTKNPNSGFYNSENFLSCLLYSALTCPTYLWDIMKNIQKQS